MPQITVKINYDTVPKKLRLSFERSVEEMISNFWSIETDSYDIDAFDIETSIEYDGKLITTKETQR